MLKRAIQNDFFKVLACQWQNQIYFYGMFSKISIQVFLIAKEREQAFSQGDGGGSWELKGVLEAWLGFELSSFPKTFVKFTMYAIEYFLVWYSVF